MKAVIVKGISSVNWNTSRKRYDRQGDGSDPGVRSLKAVKSKYYLREEVVDPRKDLAAKA